MQQVVVDPNSSTSAMSKFTTDFKSRQFESSNKQSLVIYIILGIVVASALVIVILIEVYWKKMLLKRLPLIGSIKNLGIVETKTATKASNLFSRFKSSPNQFDDKFENSGIHYLTAHDDVTIGNVELKKKEHL